MLAAVVLGEPYRDYQPRTRRAALLGTPLELGYPRHGVWLQEGQDLVQPVELDGLAHEIRRAELEALTSLTLVDDARHGDDRDAERAHRAKLQEVEPAHARELDVEQNRVEALGLEAGEGGFGRVHDQRMVAELDEELAEDIAEVDLVLDNQHPHARSSVAR